MSTDNKCFMENWRKLFFNDHQIPFLTVPLGDQHSYQSGPIMVVSSDQWLLRTTKPLKYMSCERTIWATPWQNQQNDCAPSKDSDQPGHPPSLIRVFAVRMKKAWILSYPLSTGKTLIRLGGCPGWSESSLGALAILLVLSWGGSFYSITQSALDHNMQKKKLWVTSNGHSKFAKVLEVLRKHSVYYEWPFGVISNNHSDVFSQNFEYVRQVISRNFKWSWKMPFLLPHNMMVSWQYHIWARTWQNQQNECVPSEDW